MRRFVIGDIHGSYRGMIQVLERAGFNKEEDLLIGIGDYVDGWPESSSVISYIMELPNFLGVIGNHDCFSDDTEALTDSGWKNYKDITLNDKILSLDTNTNKLCWDNINEIIIKEVDEELYKFSNQHIDMFITKTHRVLHQKRGNKKTWNDYEYKHIEDLVGRIRIPTGGICPKNGIDLTDDEIKFIAWILTDGGIFKTKFKNYYTIYQSKEKTKDRIRNLLNRLNYEFTEKVRDNDVKVICGKTLKKKPLPQSEFRISSECSQKIKEYFPNKYPFPSFLLDMNNDQFNIFFEEIILGDGTFYNRKQECKTAMLNGKKEFLDFMQILCIQNNKRAVLVTDTRGNYRLNISDYSSTSFDIKDKVEKIPYKGTVWCLSVPKTNFMVRRNGKPFISGNCWTSNWLKGGNAEYIWVSQGGAATIKSYEDIDRATQQKHGAFLQAMPYYLEIDNMAFIHGGVIYPNFLSEVNNIAGFSLMWDRELYFCFAQAYKFNSEVSVAPFKKVFIGHTQTSRELPDFTPFQYKGLWNIDQGAGWNGKLTLVDIDTDEWWQSDFSQDLYPEEPGRR